MTDRVTALRLALIADASVAAIVGEAVHVSSAPGGAAPPYLVLAEISDVGAPDLDGDDEQEVRVQIDAHARSRADAKALAKSAAAAARRFGARRTSGFEGDEGAGRYRVSQDLMLDQEG